MKDNSWKCTFPKCGCRSFNYCEHGKEVAILKDQKEESQEESVKSVIADTLYSTGKFPPEVCDEIACVIIRDLTDAQLIITRRKP